MADNRVAEHLRKPYAGGLQSWRARSGKCMSWHLALLSLIIKFRDNTKVLLFYVMGLPYSADGIDKRLAFAEYFSPDKLSAERQKPYIFNFKEEGT